MMVKKGAKIEIGQEIFIIERDLTVTPKKIMAIINEEKEIRYKLDTYSCNGLSSKEVSMTESEAKIKRQNFLNGLRFIVGDLLVFQHEEYQSKSIVIGQLTKIVYGEKPYVIKTTNDSIHDITDNSVILKVKNEYIENFGNLKELGTEINKTIKEYEILKGFINSEYDQLEKELKQSFKRQFSYSWTLKRRMPLFKDRFDYNNYEDDE